jgi:hypothetical protein
MHWEDLKNHPVHVVLAREGVNRAPRDIGYDVSFLNGTYRVDTVHNDIRELSPHPTRVLTEEFQILVIRYLVAPYGGPLTGSMVSEKDLPGGVTFFQGPHAIPTQGIARAYATDPEKFVERGERLGGVRADYGDGAVRFHPFPLMPVTYVLWAEDEEFPASVTVLFDSSLARWFELDMIFTLVLTLSSRIMEDR